MAREKKQAEEDIPEGAPEWMVTFSDCMTLLLTFFVLLLSFSSFSDKQEAKFIKVADSLAYELSFSEQNSSNESVMVVQETSDAKQRRKGSEQPTQENAKENNLMKESDPMDFRDQKVFLLASDQVFWGKGTRITPSGQKQLAAMAEYFKKMRNRIVITESALRAKGDPADLGLRRAWAIVDFMTKQQRMDRELFSISTTGTVDGGAMPPSMSQTDRALEIVLLERRIYN
ncbi:MAG: flagellar motor protein MotB [Planctomycetota bacterium]|jgi:chemotaxis protein MotB